MNQGGIPRLQATRTVARAEFLIRLAGSHLEGVKSRKKESVKGLSTL
jgi:hypothetical protein